MPYSTTQLAKKLNRDTRDLFSLLAERGWIHRDGKNWRLTAKGEFEGGSYTQHDKYGEYIVWPEEILQHRLFSAEQSHLISVTQLGRPYNIAAKRMNFILAELGWIERFHHGWKLTELGKKAGGSQTEHESTGVPYTQWSEKVRHNLHFKTTIETLTQHNEHLNKEADFFISAGNLCHCLDGHQVESAALAEIDNWLYCSGVNHAYRRDIPTPESVREVISCDFYLPESLIYIEYWGQEQSPADIQHKMMKKEIYQAAGLKLIELNQQDIHQLDEVLPKLLLQHDLDLY